MTGAQTLTRDALDLLIALIRTPSFSGEESGTAQLVSDWLQAHGIQVQRKGNNIWATHPKFDVAKPTILLNSHHDTVRPNQAYSRDPFAASIEEGKLYGLGSNDAGGALVSLLATFVHFSQAEDLTHNLLIAASAEEENSGPNGLNSLLQSLPDISFAIVGEPTEMQLAIAEKGLLVIDAVATGTPGHAAHLNPDMAIDKALADISWLHQYQFPKVSDFLGPVKMTVTQINAGHQHNVIPSECRFVVDVRINEHYTNTEVFDIIDAHTQSALQARSFRHNASSIPVTHPIIQAGISLGRRTYGSPTLSDQAVLSCPSLKLGPGDSKRSHQADEFIYVHEIEEGIGLYIEILNQILRP